MIRTKAMLPVFLVLSLAFLWAGCSEEGGTSGVNGSSMTDELALQQLILQDGEIEGLDAWGGDENALGGGGLDEPIEPIGWHRWGRPHVNSVRVEIHGDTFAVITRFAALNGGLRVITERTDSSFIYYDKPMFNRLVRVAHAVRVGHGPDPLRNWRIVAVSPEDMMSVEPNPHTVWPVFADFFRRVGDELMPIMHIRDPLHTFFPRDHLPLLHPGDELIVRTAINRPGPVVAVFHPCVRPDRPHLRLPLRDDGMFPDEIAGDGVFAASFLIEDHHGVFLAAVDFIEGGTIHDSEMPYDAGGWAVPYRVAEEM
ncbi:hypothetical protein KKH27_01120 [bacterium]|nr:hypothetical protein [bacterium]MBU1983728.1 hypothetical protein [bacterium]